MRKQSIGIIGYGEIGKAIARFYDNPRIKDLDRNDGLWGIDILHICFPYSRHFVKIVKREIAEIKPNLTIIHSTVAPGTTKKIGGQVVHSPIRGTHPDLYEGIKTFIKYVGADDKRAARHARRHLRGLGIPSKTFMPSETTEVGKLLSTAYYGLCIAFHGEAQRLCQKYGVDFSQAMTDFNKTYNRDWPKLGRPEVIRPILYPPENNRIGGHCIIANAKLLKKYFKSKALDLILKYAKGRAKKPNQKRP